MPQAMAGGAEGDEIVRVVGAAVASGVYFVQLETAGRITTRRLALIR